MNRHENQNHASKWDGGDQGELGRIFLKLFNDCGETNLCWDILISNSKKDKNYMLYKHIYLNEIKQAMKKIKHGRVVEQNNILIEVSGCMRKNVFFN